MSIAKKYLERVREQYRDSDGYWIDLKRGWRNMLDPMCPLHGISEDTKARAEFWLRRTEPCDCDDCKREG